MIVLAIYDLLYVLGLYFVVNIFLTLVVNGQGRLSNFMFESGL